ncbi:hypothetical protein BD626DRAFT_182132 [Schizophyllum amplum]|uniref:F-box domain-containing protein n=1 Tax=Schizophyllum amplum TaxID=97359 RepID=A0A550C1I5_9AGAR|nr:hypothetical protein BD626DRAFT_182132 [Auriculariopsis ampla]
MPLSSRHRNVPSASSFHRRAVDRVPTEILAIVFAAASLPDPSIHWDRRIQGMLAALAVSQVCRRWRQIACAAPHLWKNITIAIPFTTGKRSLVRMSLARSATAHLDINIDVRNPDYVDDSDVPLCEPDEMRECLEDILPHAQRWGNLDVICDTLPVMRAFLEKTKDVSPRQLARIALMRPNPMFSAYGTDPERDELESDPLFSGPLPRLEEVVLHGTHVDWTSPALHDLTHLEFRYQTEYVMPSWECFAALVRSSPHLHSLVLCGWGPDFDDVDTCRASSVKTLVFPALASFSFGYVDVESAQKLLSLVSMPHLQSLSIEDADNLYGPGNERCDSTPLIAQMSAHIAPRSAPFDLAKIIFLELVTVHAEQGAFARLFAGLLALDELSLVKMHPNIFSALKPLDIPALGQTLRPCAKLRRIQCRSMDASSLVGIVQTRAIAAAEGVACPPRVRALTLRNCSPLADLDSWMLQKFGVDIVVERYEDGPPDMNVSDDDDDDSDEDL